MAEPQVLEELKTNRTSAKRQFLLSANNVMRMHTVLSEQELKDSFKTLTLEANKVFEANGDVEDQYAAESELEGGGLTDQQRADLDKTSSECDTKLVELQDLIVKYLWNKFGYEELTLAVEVAESEVDRVRAITPSEGKETFEFMMEHLGELVKKAKDLNTYWKSWAPPEEQYLLLTQVHDLERELVKLAARRAEFIKVHGRPDGPHSIRSGAAAASAPQLKSTSLPKFPGTRGDFHRWRRDWELLQEQVDPNGSQEVKKVQLLNSIDGTTSRELHLSTYTHADDIFRALESRFGNKTDNAIEIVEELQRLPPVKGNQPRKIMELIQAVERAFFDLSELGETGAIRNALMTKSLERKLPDCMKKDWLLYKAERNPEKGKRFDSFLSFLKSQEAVYAQLALLQEADRRPNEKQDPEPSDAEVQACIICGHARHGQKLYFCKKFQALVLREKKDAVRKLGACTKCLQVHLEKDCNTSEFLCQRPECGEEPHHFYLCPRAERARTFSRSKTRDTSGGADNPRSYSQAQQAFVRKLPPDLVKECRSVFRSPAPRPPPPPGAHCPGERRLRAWPAHKKS